jgi:SAM-dependent methyltransferase
VSAAALWGQLRRAPAPRALLIQIVAAVPALLLARLLAAAGFPLSLFALALLQGALAAALTWRCQLAPWWYAIQLLFPAALLVASGWQLPPLAFLGAFLFLLALYWSTFRTQVPFYPSGPWLWEALAQSLPARPGLRVIDIGSGLGDVVLHLARRRPDCVCEGIELAPLPWLLSRLRARLRGSAARFARGDYEGLDFAAYDVVFAYLSPAVMAALWDKARREMRPGSMLLSYEFEIAARAPDRVVRAPGAAAALYAWSF